MHTQGTESTERPPSTAMGAVMGVAMIPVLAVGACLAIPYTVVVPLVAAASRAYNCGC